MAKNHRGRPSNTNGEQGTGKPAKLQPEDLHKNDEMTEKYTDDDSEIGENVQTRHPNRNTDKGDATTAGGYKN
jgi:hypothetical protein